MPWVNYQEDMYMGTDRTCYDVTKHPDSMDAVGFRGKESAPKVFKRIEDRPP